jgi:hypothetical protein
MAEGVQPRDFNQYGARRGNHEVMMRGTFANIRLRNLLVPGIEGGVTVHVPSGETISIYDAAMRYKAEHTPLIVIAGKEYGTGSSRDWAAKGPMLLGVRAVIAETFERIHRSNHRHGRAAAVSGRDDGSIAWAERPRAVRNPGPATGQRENRHGGGNPSSHARIRFEARVRRHAQGTRVLPAWRHLHTCCVTGNEWQGGLSRTRNGVGEHARSLTSTAPSRGATPCGRTSRLSVSAS